MAARDEGARRRKAQDSVAAHTIPSWLVFGGLLVLRLVNALAIQTFFQPDEYFQSLEPAWQIAFGDNSGSWITWEWREQLRSSMHPMLFAAIYRGAAQLCDFIQASPTIRAEVLLAAPKVLQACIAAVGDLLTWQLACKVYGSRQPASFATLALNIFSPWQWFCSVRTLSNSLETTLTIVALNYWPWSWFLKQRPADSKTHTKSAPRHDLVQDANVGVQKIRSSLEPDDCGTSDNQLASARYTSDITVGQALPIGLNVSLTAAAIACILRPTNIVIWANVAPTLLYRHGDLHKTNTLARHAFTCGSAALVVSVSMDRVYYGEWTFPPLKFLYFNVVQSLSVFYGTNRPDYYFTEGLPLLLTTALPFAAIGIWQALRPEPDLPVLRGHEERQSRFVLAMTVLATVIIMSLISHKEVRFIYPLLPMLHILAAKPLATFFHTSPLSMSKVRLGLMLLMLSINVYVAAYVSLVHQRGVLDVVHYLRHKQEARLLSSPSIEGTFASRNVTAGFLMPCHSTPWRSHLVHPEVQAWALTCEPPLNISVGGRSTYHDEADVFYAGPESWIDHNMEDRTTIATTLLSHQPTRNSDARERKWPEFLVFFQHLLPVMERVLEETRYEECWRGFNTHWHDDARRQGDVIVWRLRS